MSTRLLDCNVELLDLTRANSSKLQTNKVVERSIHIKHVLCDKLENYGSRFFAN